MAALSAPCGRPGGAGRPTLLNDSGFVWATPRDPRPQGPCDAMAQRRTLASGGVQGGKAASLGRGSCPQRPAAGGKRREERAAGVSGASGVLSVGRALEGAQWRLEVGGEVDARGEELQPVENVRPQAAGRIGAHAPSQGAVDLRLAWDMGGCPRPPPAPEQHRAGDEDDAGKADCDQSAAAAGLAGCFLRLPARRCGDREGDRRGFGGSDRVAAGVPPREGDAGQGVAPRRLDDVGDGFDAGGGRRAAALAGGVGQARLLRVGAQARGRRQPGRRAAAAASPAARTAVVVSVRVRASPGLGAAGRPVAFGGRRSERSRRGMGRALRRRAARSRRRRCRGPARRRLLRAGVGAGPGHRDGARRKGRSRRRVGGRSRSVRVEPGPACAADPAGHRMGGPSGRRVMASAICRSGQTGGSGM